MKNFDIENLERKNTYKIPEGFFGKMQENVIRETGVSQEKHITTDKKGKIFKLNFSYAVAASLVLLFGIFAFNQFGNSETEHHLQSTFSDSTRIVSEQQPHSEAVQAYKALESEIEQAESNTNPVASRTIAVQTVKPEDKKTGTSPGKTKLVSSEVQMDQVMSQLSRTELADLGRAAEQDIYLDLYN